MKRIFNAQQKIRIVALCLTATIFLFSARSPKQINCDFQLRWFSVGGFCSNTVISAISQIQPVLTFCGDVFPNEVPSGSRTWILVTFPFNSCAITEDCVCALGYFDYQLEVRFINGQCFWVPKANEFPACAIWKSF